MPTEKESMISTIVNQLEKLPERVEDTRETVSGWRDDLKAMVKSNPVGTVLGAFVLGWVVAKVGRFL